MAILLISIKYIVIYSFYLTSRISENLLNIGVGMPLSDLGTNLFTQVHSGEPAI